MEFDNENSRCVSAGPEPDARVCVTLRGEECRKPGFAGAN